VSETTRVYILLVLIGILLLELIGINGGTGNSKTTPVPNSNVSVATSEVLEYSDSLSNTSVQFKLGILKR